MVIAHRTRRVSRLARWASTAVTLLWFLGCSAPSSTGPTANTSQFAGSWAVLSMRIVYDAGGASDVSLTGTPLDLGSDGTWRYGSSHGHFTVDAITAADWTKWEASPYGPTRKLTFSDWQPSPGDGPVDESASQVNYIWVVYHIGPPTVSQPGLMEIRFYHQ